MRAVSLLPLLLWSCWPAPATSLSLWTWFVIFPQIRCFLRLFFLNYNPEDFDRFDVFFRDSTVFTIAETGAFYGPEEILEYQAAGSNAGPYFLTPIGIDNLSFTFQSYDSNSGTCAFLGSAIVSQTSNPTNTGGDEEIAFQTATLTKIQLDLAEGFIKDQRVFLLDGYWNVALRTLQGSDEALAFICSVMENSCAGILPERATDNCLARLSELDGSGSHGGSTLVANIAE